MKLLLAAQGLPVGRTHVLVTARHWERDPESVRADVEELGYPVFVKPARAGFEPRHHPGRRARPTWTPPSRRPAGTTPGSSSRPRSSGREIECAVLESIDGGAPRHEPARRDPGGRGARVLRLRGQVPRREEGARLVCPADLPDVVVHRVRDLAARTFEALGCEGLARVDFFVRPDGEVLVNEINTMPGFTPISMYPLMWAGDRASTTRRWSTGSCSSPCVGAPGCAEPRGSTLGSLAGVPRSAGERPARRARGRRAPAAAIAPAVGGRARPSCTVGSRPNAANTTGSAAGSATTQSTPSTSMQASGVARAPRSRTGARSAGRPTASATGARRRRCGPGRAASPGSRRQGGSARRVGGTRGGFTRGGARAACGRQRDDGERCAQMCTTVHVSVRVMPLTSWIRAMTSWPSSSTLWRLHPGDHVVGAGDVLGERDTRDLGDGPRPRPPPCPPRSG